MAPPTATTKVTAIRVSRALATIMGMRLSKRLIIPRRMLATLDLTHTIGVTEVNITVVMVVMVMLAGTGVVIGADIEVVFDL